MLVKWSGRERESNETQRGRNASIWECLLVQYDWSEEENHDARIRKEKQGPGNISSYMEFKRFGFYPIANRVSTNILSIQRSL